MVLLEGPRGGRILMSDVPLYVESRLEDRGGVGRGQPVAPGAVAHIWQSRPDSGLGFQVKVLTTSSVVPFSFDSGTRIHIQASLPPASLNPTPQTDPKT